jgi:hypothetical protein
MSEACPSTASPALCELLDVLQLAREVCTLAKVDPAFPPSIGPDVEEQIRRVHALLSNGEYRTRGEKWTLTVVRKETSKAIPKANGDLEIGVKEPADRAYEFLDTTVNVRIVKVVLTKAASKVKRLANGDSKYVFQSPHGEFIERSDKYEDALDA